jgi:hypothetical protein
MMGIDPYDPLWYLALAYLFGAIICFLVLCYDIGKAPEHITPPPIQGVLFMSFLWPLMMPLIAYVQWVEQRAEKKTP